MLKAISEEIAGIVLVEISDRTTGGFPRVIASGIPGEILRRIPRDVLKGIPDRTPGRISGQNLGGIFEKFPNKFQKILKETLRELSEIILVEIPKNSEGTSELPREIPSEIIGEISGEMPTRIDFHRISERAP